MRLRERLSAVVALTLSSCGGATSESSESSEAERCPYIEVVNRFDVQVTQSQLCAEETEKRIYAPNRGERTVSFQSASCAQLCGDPNANACLLPPSLTVEQWNLLQQQPSPYPADPDGGAADGGGAVAPQTKCPFAERVGAQSLTCEQRVSRGTRHSGCPVEGRRPAGYVAPSLSQTVSPAGSPQMNIIAAYFAMSADLEAASVIAFEDLRHDLMFHGAPRDIVDDCELAALDEIEHAASIGAVAHRFGGPLPVQHVRGRKPPRKLFEIALENAVEGCVRELFGAAQALYRAEQAEDPALRETLKKIADDECRHAELSLRIGSYLDERLHDEERDIVRMATFAARDALREEISCCDETHPDLVRIAGVPTRTAALALLEHVNRL